MLLASRYSFVILLAPEMFDVNGDLKSENFCYFQRDTVAVVERWEKQYSRCFNDFDFPEFDIKIIKRLYRISFLLEASYATFTASVKCSSESSIALLKKEFD